MTPRLAAALALALLPAAVQAESPRVAEILAAARAECAEIDAGGLLVEPGAVTAADLDNDGAADDEVVDFNAVFCDYNYSHWHGTAGAPIHFVIDGTRSAAWWGHNWMTTVFDGMPLILLTRHGLYCDSYGAAPCVLSIAVTEDGFNTVLLADPDGGPDY